MLGIESRYSCMYRFPKIKEEGWFLVIADDISRELLALKRLSIPVSQLTKTRLLFPAKNEAGDAVERATLYILSDSYLGLDQQLAVVVDSNEAVGARYLKTRVGPLER
jgi:pre-mRNA-splicing helicase BRR2